MSSWTDLVTTALLGTERRPLPDDLPAGWSGRGGDRREADGAREAGTQTASRVLALAARRRAVTLAGAPLDRVPVPAGSSPAPPAPAPRAAQDLLASMLAQPEPELVNLWLTACAARELGVVPDLWTRLARLASRSTAYDRVALLQVVGARGRWFFEQNPQWAALSCEAQAPSGAAAVLDGHPAPEAVPPDEDDSAVLAALQLVLGGSLGAGTRAAAIEVASRLPLDLVLDHEAASGVRGYASPARAWGQRATGRSSELRARQQSELTLALIDRVLEVRRGLRSCFDASPTPEPGHQPGEKTP